MMSNRQLKKAEEREMRKNSVENLLKKSDADKNLCSESWAAQYEERKAKAIKDMQDGSQAARVGSMSAFHSGPYAQQSDSDSTAKMASRGSLVPAGACVPDERSIPHLTDQTSFQPRMMPTQSSGISPGPSNRVPPVSSVPVEREDPISQSEMLPPVISKPGTSAAKSSVARPSPLDLIRMEKQNPDIYKQFGKIEGEDIRPAESEANTEAEEESSGSKPEAVKDPSKMSMAQLFRAVKCDSKRSSENWQNAYAMKKKARIEEEVKRHENRKLTNDLSSVKQSFDSLAGQQQRQEDKTPQQQQQPLHSQSQSQPPKLNYVQGQINGSSDSIYSASSAQPQYSNQGQQQSRNNWRQQQHGQGNFSYGQGRSYNSPVAAQNQYSNRNQQSTAYDRFGSSGGTRGSYSGGNNYSRGGSNSPFSRGASSGQGGGPHRGNYGDNFSRGGSFRANQRGSHTFSNQGSYSNNRGGGNNPSSRFPHNLTGRGGNQSGGFRGQSGFQSNRGSRGGGSFQARRGGY